MKDYLTLNHTKWDCKYHVVFIPKRRKKRIYGYLRKELGKMFHALAQQKESKIAERNLQADHVHMCIQPAPRRTRRRTALEADSQVPRPSAKADRFPFPSSRWGKG